MLRACEVIALIRADDEERVGGGDAVVGKTREEGSECGVIHLQLRDVRGLPGPAAESLA